MNGVENGPQMFRCSYMTEVKEKQEETEIG